jgi:gliding motility-associated-like protein
MKKKITRLLLSLFLTYSSTIVFARLCPEIVLTPFHDDPLSTKINTFLDTTWASSESKVSSLKSTAPTMPVSNTISKSSHSCTAAYEPLYDNLVKNGDFELGNVNFTSNYAYKSGTGTAIIYATGSYAVATDPKSVHSGFATMGDHTTGTGKMMIANGSTTANVMIWSQKVSGIKPNTKYLLSAYLASCTPNTPAILSFSIEGQKQGANISPGAVGIWTQFYTEWNSGSISGDATITITNMQSGDDGNDFALDDISLTESCETCSCEYKVVEQDDMGVPGTTPFGGPLPNITTAYTYKAGSIAANQYTRVINPKATGNPTWADATDHTGNGGYMLVFDADSQLGVFYEKTYDNLCAGTKCKFSIYAANITWDRSWSTKPRAKVELINTQTNAVLQSYDSGLLPFSEKTSINWQELPMQFTIPQGVSSVKLRVTNMQNLTLGNDIAFDDATFSVCVPSLTLTTSNSGNKFCKGASTSLSVPDLPGYSFQWQKYNGTVWQDIANQTSTRYTTPALTTDTKYRVRYAVTGIDITNNNGFRCSGSAEIQLQVAAPPTVTVSFNQASVCTGSQAEIIFEGGPYAKVTYSIDDNKETIELDDSGFYYITVPVTKDTKFFIEGIKDVLNTSCITSTERTQIQIPTKPAVNVTVLPASICSGSTATLNFDGPASAKVTYNINGSDRTVELDGEGSYSTTSTVTNNSKLIIKSIKDIYNASCPNATINTEIPLNITAVSTVSTASTEGNVCVNTVLQNITHTTTGATGINTAGTTQLPAGVTASWNSNTITISGTPTAVGVYNYSIPLTGGCGTAAAAGKITVTTQSETRTTANSTICKGEIGLLSAVTGSGVVPEPVLVFQDRWNTATDPKSLMPTPVENHQATCSFYPDIYGSYKTITFSVNVTGTYSLQMTGENMYLRAGYIYKGDYTPGSCSGSGTWITGDDDFGPINTKIPTLTARLEVGTLYTLVSIINVYNDPNYSTAYTWTLTPPERGGFYLTPLNLWYTSLTGGEPIGWGPYLNPLETPNSGVSNSPGSTTFYAGDATGCSVRVPATFTILEDNTVGAASATPTVSVNTALPAITHTTTSATGIDIARATKLPPGVTASWASNVITISGTPTAAGDYDYSIPLAGGCGNIAATGKITVTSVLTANITGTTTVCMNEAAPKITFTANNGIAPYTFTYSINGGPDLTAVTGIADNNINITVPTDVAGTYTYTLKKVKDMTVEQLQNGKSATVTINLQPKLLTKSATSNCNAFSDDLPSINLTTAVRAESDPGIITYWKDSEATIPVENPAKITASGDYYIKLTNTEGCSSMYHYPISIMGRKPTLVVNQPAKVCPGGSVDLTAAAITLGSSDNIKLFYYLIDAETFVSNPSSVTIPGDYWVRANYFGQDGIAITGCTILKPVTVAFKTIAAQADIIAANQNLCSGKSIQLTATAPTYTNPQFKWYSDAQLTMLLGTGTELSVTPVATTSYYITVEDDNHCVNTAATAKKLTVTLKNLPIVPVVTETSATCATIGISTISNYVLENTYIFDPTGPTVNATGLITGMTTGTLYKVASVNGDCTSSYSASFKNDAQLPALAAPTCTKTDPSTCTNPTGSITVTAPIGATYQYAIDGGTYQPSLLFSNVSSGTSHTITVKETASGCVSVPTTVSINAAPSAPTATIAYPAISYTNVGTAEVTRTGQAGGTYSAQPAGLSINPTTGVIDLKNSLLNTYTVTYTFSNAGCTNTAATTITVTGPLITAWLSVRDANGNGTVEPGETLTFYLEMANIDPNHVTLNNVTGTIELPSKTTFVSSNISPYPGKVYFSGTKSDFPYLWNLSNTKQPTLVLTVKADCDLTDVDKIETIGKVYINGVEVKISTPPAHVQDWGSYITVSGQNQYIKPPALISTCPDGCPTGLPVSTPKIQELKVNDPLAVCAPATIDLTLATITNGSTGIGTLTYFTDKLATVTLAAPKTVTTSGTYYIKSTTAAGCSDEVKPVVVTVNSRPTVTFTQINPATCAVLTGSITITAPIGANYEYALDDGTYQSDVLFSEITSGNHSVTARQITSECTSLPADVVIIAAPSAPARPTFTQIDPTTCAISTGSITITAPIGADYEYSIDAGTYQSDVLFSGVTSGSHKITVRQTASGCISAPSDVVINAAPSAPAKPTFTQIDPTTCAVSTGSITVTTPIGAGYEYSLDGGTYQSEVLFTGVTSESHKITVKQTASGCISAPSDVVINAAPSASAKPTFTQIDPTTCAVPTGSITITAPIGAGYEYSLDGGVYQSEVLFAEITSGDHSIVTREITSGCTSLPADIVINAAPSAPAKPEFTKTDPTTCDLVTGSITVTAPIGVGYEYSIDGGTYQSDVLFSGITSGDHKIIVKQTASGCISAPADVVIIAAPSAPTAPTFTQIDPTTCAVPTGTITVTAPIGTAYEYSIDGETYQAEAVFSNVASGNYTITAREIASGCVSAPADVVINTAPSAPVAPTFTKIDPTTCAVLTGSITVTAPVGADYEYSLDGGAYQSEVLFSGVASESHKITVKQTASGCISAPSDMVINAAPSAPAKPTFTQIDPTTCAVSTGSITVTAPIGAGYEYSLDGGAYQSEVLFSGVTSESHKITVKQTASGCISAPSDVVINAAPSVPAKPTFTQIDPTTCAVSTGSITVTAPIGAGYEYSLDGGAYQSEVLFTEVTSESHKITVRQTASGCISAPSDVVINAAPSAPAKPTFTQIDPTTCAVPTGSITVTAPIGAGYEYSLDGGVYQSEVLFTEVTSESHKITVRQTASGCISAPSDVVINAAPSAPAKPTFTQIDPTTCAVPTGSITVTAPIGAGYEYSLDGGVYQSEVLFAEITSGDHSIVTREITSGCTSLPADIVINVAPSAPTAPTFTQIDPTTCAVTTGSITVTAPIGVGYEYSLDGGTYQSEVLFSGVTSESHKITVKQTASGCISAPSDVVINAAPSAPAKPTFTQIDPTTCAVSTGSITVTAPIGADYEYSLDGGAYQSEVLFSGVTSESHKIIVKQTASGCISAPADVVINAAPSAPAKPEFTKTDPTTCDLVTGSITVTAPIGSEYEYSLDGGTYQSEVLFSGITSGDYKIIVKQTASGCISAPADVVINAAPSAPTAPTFTQIDPTTCAVLTGSIIVTAPIGADYEYALDGGTYQSEILFSGVTSGSHKITVRQTASGCISAPADVVINAAPSAPPKPTFTQIDPTTCAVPTGSITVTAPIGAGYEYSIDGETYQAEDVFSNVASGNYTITVREIASGCISAPSDVVINAAPSAPPKPEFTKIDPTTCAVPTGSITVTAPIGAGYEYSIDGGTYQSEVLFSGVTSESHKITVKQTASGCISAPSDVVINAAPSAPTAPTFTQIDPTTCAVPTGTITVTAPIGTAYEYSIDGETYQAEAVFSNVASGNYTITAREIASGCVSAPAEVVINAAPSAPITPTFTKIDPTTCAVLTGSITVTAPVGADYEYSLDGETYQAEDVFSNVASGNYTITVREIASDCVSAPAEVVINAAPSAPITPTFTKIDPTTCVVLTGSITITAPIGADYEYSLDGETYQTEAVFSNLTPDIYHIIAREITSGCVSAPADVVINAVPSAPITPTFTKIDPTTCAVPTGSITVTAPIGAAYEYSIDRETYQAEAVFSNVASGNYTITAREITSGCVSAPADVVINAVPSAPITPTFTKIEPTTCAVPTGTITITAPIGVVYEYSTDGETYQTEVVFSNVASGNYTITAREITSGCVSAPAEVVINAAPSAPITPIFTKTEPTTCAVPTGSITVIAPMGAAYEYSLDGETYQAQAVFSNLTPDTYHIVAREIASGCISASAEVVINAAPSAPTEPTFTKIDPTICTVPTGTITVTAPIGANYEYALNGGTYQSAVLFTGLEPGNYGIIARETASHCISAEVNVIIIKPKLLEAKTLGPISQETCLGNKDGAFSIEISGGNSPYSYSLDKSTGTFVEATSEQTVFDFENLLGGKHILYIKDITGCTTQIEVNIPLPISIKPVVNINYSCTNNLAQNSVTVTIDRNVNSVDVDYALDGGVYQSDNVFTNILAGEHTITARHINGCEQTTSPFMIEQIEPLTVTMADGDLNEIVATATDGSNNYKYSFEEEPFSTANKYIIHKSGIYTVTVTDEYGCTATTSRYFEYIDVCISNYFTPNGDGINDEWGPDCTINYKNLTYIIFDRYGRVIAQYKLGQKWDGKYNGVELTSGDYWYVLKLNDPKDNREFVGHFTLYR